jgi:hypothetical protein
MKVQRFYTAYSVPYTQNKITLPPIPSVILHNPSMNLLLTAPFQQGNEGKTFAFCTEFRLAVSFSKSPVQCVLGRFGFPTGVKRPKRESRLHLVPILRMRWTLIAVPMCLHSVVLN